jgi:hypothetical protein
VLVGQRVFKRSCGGRVQLGRYKPLHSKGPGVAVKEGRIMCFKDKRR